MLSIQGSSFNKFYHHFFDYHVVTLSSSFSYKYNEGLQFYGMTATNKYHQYPRVSWRFKSILTLQGNNMTT
jgi:hypothetical protein